jgi:hypothetical protein
MLKMVYDTSFKLGLSVAVVALSAGMAWAEDEVIDTRDGDEIVVVDDGTWETPDVFVGDGSDEDMIAWSGEIIEGEAGEDPVYLEDVPEASGEGDPEFVEEEFVPTESECGGCEYMTADANGRPAMINARGDSGAQAETDGWDNGGGVDPFARGNICFDDATYVGFLCDWQRPFLGDAMAAQ